LIILIVNEPTLTWLALYYLFMSNLAKGQMITWRSPNSKYCCIVSWSKTKFWFYYL